MPGFDGRGPAGRGPGSGRGLGICRSAGISAGGYRKGFAVSSPGKYAGRAGFTRSRRGGVDVNRRQEEQ